MKINQLLTEHKKGVKAKKYTKKSVPLVGPDAQKKKEQQKKNAPPKTELQSHKKLVAQNVSEAHPNQQISRYNPDGDTYRQEPMPVLDKDPVDNAEPLDILKNEPIETDFNKSELKRLISKNLEDLNKQQKAVLKARYWSDMTYDEIANRFNLSIERVRQIEAKSLRMLRGKMKADDYFEEVNETAKLSTREKFKRSLKRAGYDPDAGAKRIEDLLAKQKKEREEREKQEKEQGVAEGSETHKYKVVVKGDKRSYSVWVEAKNEEVAIIRAQQYVAREHNDTAKRAAVVDMKQGVAEGFSDIVKGVKRKVAGKADPKEVEKDYAVKARREIGDANRYNNPAAYADSDKAVKRYNKVAKVVNKEGVAEGEDHQEIEIRLDGEIVPGRINDLDHARNKASKLISYQKGEVAEVYVNGKLKMRMKLNTPREYFNDEDMKETKQPEALKPRNFVAKNAKTAGAGKHKDAKRATKDVRGQKHKNKELAETEMGKIVDYKPGQTATLNTGPGMTTIVDLKKNPTSLTKDPATGKLKLVGPQAQGTPAAQSTQQSTIKAGDQVEIGKTTEDLLRLAGLR